MLRHVTLSAGLTAVLLFATTASAADKAGTGQKLFNGKDLSGWVWVQGKGKSPIESVWSVKDGILICKGRPAGYIRTTKTDYANYKLSLQWRWKPGSKGGNSGVLVHAQKPDTVWPKSVESQLFRGNAGDFWTIGGTTIEIPNADKRRKGRRHLNLTDDSEKKIGEWNTMTVTCKGDELIVHVNGVLVNHAKKSSVTSGAICLQSEGAEVHFRNVVLTPLK
jgi:hypothetical protein